MSNFELSVITNRPRFNNPRLEHATQLLMQCDSEVRTRQYDIASILGSIESEKLYVDDGFDSTAEYAMTTFGIQKTLAYELIDIGMNYTRTLYNDEGKIIGHCSNLLPPANPEKQDAPLIDFTPNKIGKLKVLGRDKVLELIERGDIKPNMTFKQLAEIVKLNKAKAIPEPAEPTEPTQPTEPTEPRVTDMSRHSEYNHIATDCLIAELRARGYTVYRDNVEQIIDWKKGE